MARKSDVVKKILRFKLQLSDTTEPTTVLKILQKLKDLDITLDILAETGIGKTVNSFRRHKQAGEVAKSLVKGWKTLVPKQSSRHGEDGAFSESNLVKVDDLSCPDHGCSPVKDLHSNSSTPNGTDLDTSDEAPSKTQKKKAETEKRQLEEMIKKRKKNSENLKNQQENHRNLPKNILTSDTKFQADDSGVSKKKKKSCDNLLGSKNNCQNPKFRSDSNERLRRTSEAGRFKLERESDSKSKESTPESRKSFSSRDKPSKKIKEVKDNWSSDVSKRSDVHKRKRKKSDRGKQDAIKSKPDSENKKYSKHKKAKMESPSDPEEPSMSFESYLNYDEDILKRKEQTGVKKAQKTYKISAKEQTTKDPVTKPVTSPDPVPKQMAPDALIHLMDIPLPALPELEKPSSVDYIEKRAEKEPDFCDVSEDSAIFTGQRLNRKMQVYSGTKTLFLPTMMSLFQQCIRTLQNNINLLHETGGVPFDLLEPVLERCTPEQLLRIEECNPIYVGVTDDLWGKHCQRDFKHCRLQEYESWKEMYVRLSEERERKLRTLTKSIVSAQSMKPKGMCVVQKTPVSFLKGRQVKMAFIHSVAKPPRDVRIQQEIHGTAVQQPHLLKSSVKSQDNQTRSSCVEPSRSSSTSSAGSNAHDPRKKTKIAPMMAKSLKVFKKQLGRR
nr:elongin A, like isoform X2 [Nothobranchius furzeri]